MKVLNIKVRHVMGLRDVVEMDVRDDNLIFVGGGAPGGLGRAC